MALASAVSGAYGLLVIALFVHLIVRAFVGGDLPRNGMLGLRTADTKRSEAAWRAGHAAALPGLRRAVRLAVVGASAPVVLALALGENSGSSDVVVLIAMALGYLVVLGLLVRAVGIANAAARKAP